MSERVKYTHCIECGAPKLTWKQQRSPRCGACRYKRNPYYANCVKCGAPKTTYGQQKNPLCAKCNDDSHRLEGAQLSDAEIIALYQGGLSFRKLRKQHNVTQDRATKILRAAGVPLRSNDVRKYHVNEHAFDAIDNEAAAYWYGFLYADGTVAKHFVSLALARKDDMTVVQFAEFMESDALIRRVNYGTLQTRTAVNGVHLTARLRELGIVPGRSNPAAISENVPRPLFHHWLRGLFDGDGAACADANINFCGGGELLTMIRDILAEDAGLNPNLTVHHHRTADICYMNYHRYKAAIAVANYMYSDATIWMPRKRDVIEGWPKPLNNSDRVKLGWVHRREHGLG